MASRIEKLAQAIGQNTGSVAHYLKSNDLPFPSFDVDAPLDLQLQSKDVEQARQAAISECMELLDLLKGPHMCLRPCVRSAQVPDVLSGGHLELTAVNGEQYNGASLQVIYKYKIATKVPLDREISFGELAARCNLYEPDLRRVVRFGIAHHRVFNEPKRGFLTHSAASLQLALNPDVQDGVGLIYDDFYQSFARTAEAMDRFQSQEPDQTGWTLAHNSVGQTVFQYLSAHPDRAARFGGAMRFFSGTVPSNSPLHLINSFPWASLGAGTVVDVGGFDGYVSIELAQAFPKLRFIVQDLPHIVANMAPPSELAERVVFKAHDFFTEQYIKDADVYFFRWILHDWPDAYVIKILRHLVPALKPGARIIINDNVGPGQSGILPLDAERYVRELDMIMLSVFNSYEREAEDWSRVIKEADERFDVVKLTPAPESLIAVLEIMWIG